MTLRTEHKDELTQKVRQMIGEKIPAADETARAEACLSTLSFQSRNYPERHIWLDTDGYGIAIDLEDWQDESEWDNAVARITVEAIDEVVDIVKNWFSGANLDNYSNLNQEYGIVKKKKSSFGGHCQKSQVAASCDMIASQCPPYNSALPAGNP